MPVVPVRAAFVTLAATDDYCPGALVVACSLRHHKTRHSLVCLAAPGLSSGARAALQAAFDEVVDVPRSDSGDARGLAVLGRPDLGITFTKIEAWALTNYSIACFLDADTVALKNVDELLDDTIYRPFAAAPDCGWPDCFNSGVFVFRPSWEEYERLKKLAAEEGSFDAPGPAAVWSTGFRSRTTSRRPPSTADQTEDARNSAATLLRSALSVKALPFSTSADRKSRGIGPASTTEASCPTATSS
ncbi:MAG: nucleotide-diphospho-sugar transferase [Olpidium bornovanus]|uniref:Nucleotide-diphospho-sugar transferase n=1 Tax=Olpidium bornovanus TaxID=278681 RepID=A0A8H8A262_9FUNG|nr:MAG: nucleotide-diphospho-sugar transferase [Olpidium bornovanus]